MEKEEPIEISESGGDTAEDNDAEPSLNAGDNEASGPEEKPKKRGRQKRGDIKVTNDPAPRAGPPGFSGFQLPTSWRPIMYTGPPGPPRPGMPMPVGRPPMFGPPGGPRPPFWFPPGGPPPRGMPPMPPSFARMPQPAMSSDELEEEEEEEVVKKPPRKKRVPKAKKKAQGGSDDEGGAQKRALQSETEGQSEAEGALGVLPPGQPKPKKRYKKRRTAPPLPDCDEAKEKEIAELENDPATVRTNKSEPELVGPVWEYLAALRRDLAVQVKDKLGPLYNKLRAGQLWVEPPPLPALPPTDMVCTPDLFYLPRVLLWLPEVVWGVSPHCPKCFGGGTAEQPVKSMIPKGFPNAIARRVIALDHCYYVMTRKYECERCLHAVRATDPNLVTQYPAYISGAFPAVINIRGGLDRSVVHLIEQADKERRSLVGVAEIVRNLQYERYRTIRARYCSLVALQRKTLPAEFWAGHGHGGEDGDGDGIKGEEHEGPFGPAPTGRKKAGRPPKIPRNEGYTVRNAPNNEFGFSSFNDSAGYAGCSPSVEYLRAVVETFTGPVGRPRLHPPRWEQIAANGQQADDNNASDTEQPRDGNDTADEGNNTETEGASGKRKTAKRAEARCGQCGKTTCGGAEKNGICEVAFQPGQGLVPDGKSFRTEEEVLQYKVLTLQQEQLKLQIERMKKRGKKAVTGGGAGGVGGDNTEGEGNAADAGGGEGGEGTAPIPRKKKKNKFIKETQSEVSRLQRQLAKLQEAAAMRKAKEREKDRAVAELMATGLQRETIRMEADMEQAAYEKMRRKEERRAERQGLKWAETKTPGPNYRAGTSKQGGTDSEMPNFREMYQSGAIPSGAQWMFPPGPMGGQVPPGGAMYMVPTGGEDASCRTCHDPSCPGREPGADCLRAPLPMDGGRPGKGKNDDWLAKMKKAGPGGMAGMFPGMPPFPGMPVGPPMKVDMPGPDGRPQAMIAVPVAVPAGTMPPGMRPPPGFPFHPHMHQTRESGGKSKNKGRGGRPPQEEVVEVDGSEEEGGESGEEGGIQGRRVGRRRTRPRW